jgi:diguanylate cyclase (GGDEF)-like protein
MRASRVFIFMLFLCSLGVVIWLNRSFMPVDPYMKALFLYWVFSSLYFHLRTISKQGNITVDYGINYSLSFVLFSGLLGLLLFELLFNITVHIYKKWTKINEPDEIMHTIYNIGSFVLQNVAAYLVFQYTYPFFHSFPFGYWILMAILVTITAILSDAFLIIVFSLLGEMKTRRDILEFIKSRSLLDMGKTAITNGMLFLFVKDHQWELLLALFILNFLVSRSFINKAQNLENVVERDKFKEMAYTDFLTGVSNRAAMAKEMEKLNESGEWIGIVVADIDEFKKVNDTFNHAIGDQVIQHFANTLKSILKNEDFLFRSGGEEFTLFLRNREYEETVALLEALLQKIETGAVEVEFNGEKTAVCYTASFGLYFYKVHQGVAMEKGYVYADQLLLQSKEAGKNQLSSIKQGSYPAREQTVLLSNQHG